MSGPGGTRRVACVLGTRPEVTKMAPVLRALRADPDLEPVLLVTGQHRELLRRALADVDEAPDADLELMTEDQAPGELVGRAVTAVTGWLREWEPELVLVHGDTGTTCAATLAAFLAGIPVGHVEAGLRSGSLAEPFPEEGNRRVVDSLAQVLWAPTPRAAANLRAEGLGDRALQVTGNTAVDAVLMFRDRAGEAPPPILAEIPRDARLLLVTAHRRESFGTAFRDLLRGILRAVDAHPGLHALYPVHPNPRVRGPAHEVLGGHERIHLAEPMGYLPFLAAMDRAACILTDSGGIQEEAPSLGKPVLVMRERTERPEAIEAGTAELVGTDTDRIAGAVARVLARDAGGDPPTNPYGDGRAAARIAAGVRHALGLPGDLPPDFAP